MRLFEDKKLLKKVNIMEPVTQKEIQDAVDDAIAFFVKNERRVWDSSLDKRNFDRSGFFEEVSRQIRELYGNNVPAHVNGKI